MHLNECLFCQIALGKEAAKVVWENEKYLAIENKYPKAPIHVLVIPKTHMSKDEEMARVDQSRWGEIMGATFEVVRLLNLDKTGYKLSTFGAGYNHFDHEHIHVIGGSKTAPAEA